MAVEVRVPSMLRPQMGDQKLVEAEGETVGQVLDDLERRYEGFRTTLFEDNGELRRFVNIYINDEDIRYLGRLDAPVRNGDVISILPAVAGGA